jgi:hypothetical protein
MLPYNASNIHNFQVVAYLLPFLFTLGACYINQWLCFLSFAGQKVNEVFQFKRGQYADLPAAKISEMIQSNSLDVTSLASHYILLNTYLSCPFPNDKPFFFAECPYSVTS